MSPRVREDSVHPRLQSGASVRPLNFTVRRAPMPQLLVPQGRACVYWSQKDEAAFFAWLQSIPGVTRVRGVGRQLVRVPCGRKRLRLIELSENSLLCTCAT